METEKRLIDAKHLSERIRKKDGIVAMTQRAGKIFDSCYTILMHFLEEEPKVDAVPVDEIKLHHVIIDNEGVPEVKLQIGDRYFILRTDPVDVKEVVMGMNLFRKRKPYGEYPACSHLNVALRYLLDNEEENRIPIEEIVYAISKSNGYFFDDVKDALIENNILWYGERKDND